MSKNEQVLKEYFDLSQKIKEMTKRHEELKAIIKAKGSHTTANYIAVVGKRTQKILNARAVEAILGKKTPYITQSITKLLVREK